MIQPGYAPVRSPRHQAFSLEVLVPSFDFTDQSPTFEVRANPESSVALISVGRAQVEGAAGVFMAVTFEDGIPTTRIVITIPRDRIEVLPVAKPIGSDLHTFYGFKLDGAELFGGPLVFGAQANHA